MAVERPAWRMRRVARDVQQRFGGVLAANYPGNRSIRIYFGKQYITDARELVAPISRNYLDSKEATLRMFVRAIELGQSMSIVNNDHRINHDLFDLAIRLDRLAPKFLKENRLTDLVQKAFEKGPYVRFKKLFSIGVFTLGYPNDWREAQPKRPAHQLQLPLFIYKQTPKGLFYPYNDEVIYKIRFENGRWMGYVDPFLPGQPLVDPK